MIYQEHFFEYVSPEDDLRRALHWASQVETHCLLHGNGDGNYPHASFPVCLGVGVQRAFCPPVSPSVYDELFKFWQSSSLPLMGWLGYDLKNATENLFSRHEDRIGFADMYFFEPQHFLRFTATGVHIASLCELPEKIWQTIQAQTLVSYTPPRLLSEICQRISRPAYIAAVERIKQHITDGDVYELNFCIEFFAEAELAMPADVFLRLQQQADMPFAAFLRWQRDRYLLCASPERFLKKSGDLLISQPIKGTARRGDTIAEDEQLKHALRHSEKELAENMMIVDLVRNDLARCAQSGSVQVPELFGIYTFPHLHQMISTVTAHIGRDRRFSDALRYAFPMGSMTGAPKIRAMELIEALEQTRRGLYSGALGYITPDGDFDFNVVIRSLAWNAHTRALSFQAGSAITYDADAAAEYDECMLKTRTIRKILGEV